MLAKSHMRPTRHDLPQEVRSQSIGLLNQTVADLTDLYTQTKTAHWNVTGPNFGSLHELFDELAATLLPFIDEAAERATALGGTVRGTARDAAKNSKIEEFPDDVSEGLAVVNVLCDRYAAVAASLRKGIDETDEAGDVDTSDLYTEMSRALDKSLWFLEAHVSHPEGTK